jgi:signal transduction histidine kinase/CheY-like chemotaxis protein
LLVVTGAGVRCLTHLSRDLVRSGALTQALVEQTDVDMLHDTLRGDAFAAAQSELASARGAAARAEVERHYAVLNRHLQALGGLGLSTDLRQAYAAVTPDLLRYAGDVRSFVEQPPPSRAEAAQKLGSIAAQFYALEPRLGAITVQVERDAATRRDMDLKAAADARLLLLVVGGLGMVVFAVGAWTIAARIVAQTAELEAARKAADEGSRVKSEFLSAMSHEIRTPMNGILGMVQIMSRDDIHPIQRQRLEVVRGSAETLLGILNNVLDLSKIEAGELRLERHAFDLDELVASTVALFRSLAVQKDLTILVHLSEAAYGAFLGDGLRLRQILSNLLSNAIKFTAAGAVGVRVDYAAGWLELEVSDDGIGIAPDKLAMVFDRFTQADSSTARRYGGTGLGLPLSREFAALMGGTLTATSVPGRGSIFTLRVPLERPAEVAAAAEPVAETAGKERLLRVLLAEDNATNRLIVTALLEPMQVEMTSVENGAEAVEAFCSGGFDLVLMDVQMPLMDGVEASRRIREFERRRGLGPTPIIALTANVMTHQAAEYRIAGMDAVVAKPIEAARLFGAITAVLAAAEPRAEDSYA